MSVLLLASYVDTSEGSEFYQQVYRATQPPLSLSYLSAYLKNKDISCAALDLNFSKIEDVEETIRSRSIQVIGCSVTIVSFSTAYQMMAKIKKKFPYIRIVFGGLAAELYEEALREGVLDAIVVGEGEEPLYQLACYYLFETGSLFKIPNVVFFRKGQLVCTPRQSPSIPIDRYPFPDRTCINRDQYTNPKGIATVVTSRFCPHQCVYCLSGTLGNPVRLRSVENVMEEIREIRQTFPDLSQIQFVDETFNISQTRLLNFCTALKKEKISWSCSLRPEKWITAETLSILKDSGNVLIELGVESGNPTILNNIKKEIDLNQVEYILKNSTTLGLMVFTNIMVPHYCDTPETVCETVSLMEKFVESYRTMIVPSQTAIHPNSQYGMYIEEYGLRMSPNGVILSTNLLSPRIIQESMARLNQLRVTSVMKNQDYFLKGINLDQLRTENVAKNQGFDLSKIIELAADLNF